MAYYCATSDVADRMSLSSQERLSASAKITSAIRRATIEIDQEFYDRGRSEPSKSIADNTLNGAVSAGATTVVLTSGTNFSSSGNGNIDGDSFSWTGKSTNNLTGCTGISFDHITGVAVQEGEIAHILREICADIAAGFIYEDQAVFGERDMKANTFHQRGAAALEKIARLGGIS